MSLTREKRKARKIRRRLLQNNKEYAYAEITFEMRKSDLTPDNVDTPASGIYFDGLQLSYSNGKRFYMDWDNYSICYDAHEENPEILVYTCCLGYGFFKEFHFSEESTRNHKACFRTNVVDFKRILRAEALDEVFVYPAGKDSMATIKVRDITFSNSRNKEFKMPQHLIDGFNKGAKGLW